MITKGNNVNNKYRNTETDNAISSMAKALVNLRRRDDTKQAVMFYFDKASINGQITLSHGVEKEIVRILTSALDAHIDAQHKILDDTKELISGKSEPASDQNVNNKKLIDDSYQEFSF